MEVSVNNSKSDAADKAKRDTGLLFGPIPSRRLGRSLGVNNIPPKICSYSCIYCQIGSTNSMNFRREAFFSPDEIFDGALAKISELRSKNETIDYLTFVPDGEPTLDINIGRTIAKLKVLGIKIAVITNSSLLWDRDVRNDLMNADWVSLKVDSISEEVWREINRPHGSLNIGTIMDGAVEFSRDFNGTLVTETMLVKGINDSSHILRQTASFIAELRPSRSYILVPTRPPALSSVLPSNEERLNAAYQAFKEKMNSVELLVHDEGTHFTFISDVEKELLGILAVHPMSTAAVKEFLDKARTGWGVIEKLIAEQVVREVKYAGKSYVMRVLGPRGHH